MRSIRRAWRVAAALLVAGPVPTLAQELAPSNGGLGALDQALRFLGHHKRILMIGAHPDDEDTEFLTIAARGLGAEAAYLALTRGEGGQNLIGPELGDALGVLRTEELLAARRLDGGRQFFTRAFDFGYSKTLTDTWRYWPPDSVLKDVVRVVRRFRPQIIVTMFSGTARDGHGQHQAAGWAAQEAFRVAGDSTAFPELAGEEGLAPWTPLKLYRNAWFGGDESALVLDGGTLDRAVGQSFHQIAMRSRSLHRSQDMGVLQQIGPSRASLLLVEDRTGRGSDALFAGIDTSLASLMSSQGPIDTRRRLEALGARMDTLEPWTVDALAPLRAEFVRLAFGGDSAPSIPLQEQLARIDAALFLAANLLCDALSPVDRLVPGQRVPLTVSCWNASSEPRTLEVELHAFSTSRRVETVSLGPGELWTDTLEVTVPPDESPSTPYYLARPPLPGMALYQWPADGPAGEPFGPPPAVALFRLANGGLLRREVTYRFVDQALGEVRRPLTVVPSVTLALTPASALWPVGSENREFEVTVRSALTDSVVLQVGLEALEGWVVAPPLEVRLGEPTRETTLRLGVRPAPGSSGRFHLSAFAIDPTGRRHDQGLEWIAYPHVRPRQLARHAAAELSLGRIELPPIGAIGYVRGAADRVPEVLRSLGLRVVLLGRDSLLRGGLSGFRTIVIGPRAYEVEPALEEATERLYDFVRSGGTLVVQYQQQVFFRGRFAPFPLALTERVGASASGRVAAPRVADEDAPVRLLEPDHLVFRTPHRIEENDWDDWVQERGLYFARSWGPEWTPLLAMADAGEEPQLGGLLVARLGAGSYVYTGLSFFRQLPAGVPGAARLFLNLLALGLDDASP